MVSNYAFTNQTLLREGWVLSKVTGYQVAIPGLEAIIGENSKAIIGERADFFIEFLGGTK